MEPDAMASVAAPPPAQPIPFEGPAPSLDDVCSSCRVVYRAVIPAASRSSYRAVQVVVRRESSNLGPALTNQRYFLAVRTSEGWFSHELGLDGVVCGFDQTIALRFSVHGVEVRGDEIVVQIGVEGDGERVCGLDQQGRPFCR